jgi:hypothetical protein
MNTKWCPRCESTKDLATEFYGGKSNKTYCILCQRERANETYKTNANIRIRMGLATTKYRGNENNREWRKWQHKFNSYGMTLDQYAALEESQDFQCAVCSEESTRDFHIDHNHVTGKIRGLLCGSCNMALGSFKDSIRRMLAACEYLARVGSYATDI